MPDWLIQSVGYAGGLVVVYAGIRADLARLHEKAENAAKVADSAHKRIDFIMDHGVRQ